MTPTEAPSLAVAVAVVTAGTVSAPILLNAAGEAAFRDRMDALLQRTPAGQVPVLQAVSSASTIAPPDSFLTAFDATTEAAADGTSVLVATHDERVVDQAHRVVSLRDGRVDERSKG